MKLLRSRRAVTSLEFAILASVLIPLTSAVIELGLVMWCQTAEQSVASLTARCAAISSPSCSGGVAAYAVTLSNNWTLSGAISTGNVTVTTPTTCNSATGNVRAGQISFSLWSTMVLKPFLPDSITVTSCYPSSPRGNDPALMPATSTNSLRNTAAAKSFVSRTVTMNASRPPMTKSR